MCLFRLVLAGYIYHTYKLQRFLIVFKLFITFLKCSKYLSTSHYKIKDVWLNNLTLDFGQSGTESRSHQKEKEERKALIRKDFSKKINNQSIIKFQIS